MSDLRNKLIKLAHDRPELRADLLPLLKDAALNEDVEAEVRGILEGKVERADMIKDIIGKDNFNEDTKKELIGLLQSDQDANSTLMDILGITKKAADTFKCPECGTKVLEKTGYCVKCKKKVKKAAGSIRAEITGVGSDSTVPDNPGAVDTVIYYNGREVGEATLLPDRGRLSTWGSSLDYWADRELQGFLRSVGDEKHLIIGEIEEAVNKAFRRY